MHVEAVYRGARMAVGYVAYERAGGEALIIDAPLASAATYMDVLTRGQLKAKYVVNTHGHWDLIADNVAVVAATGALLCAHAWDSARLANPAIGVEDLEEKVPPVKASRPDVYVHDGEVLEVDNLRFEVIATPGHTPGSICVYEPTAHALFAGDLVGKQWVGNTDFPGGNSQALQASLVKIADLPDNTQVFPAHGLATTIGEIRWLLDLAKAG